jgi:hypothetical protein
VIFANALLRRRILVIALFAWLPLLVLSVVEGHAWGGGVKMPFLYDVDTHVRFLDCAAAARADRARHPGTRRAHALALP